MQIVHRVSLRASREDRQEIARLNIEVAPVGRVPPDFISFDVSEAHESWPAVREWIVRRQAGDFVRTEFSKTDIAAARWLGLQSWQQGYPQPEADFGYLRTTYEPEDWCAACRVGKRQRAPFVMTGELRWGQRGILQLNWVFDEFFVTPEVWAAVFEPHGIDARPVLNRRGSELKTVLQLVVDARVSLSTSDLAAEQCSTCGRVKDLPHVRGPLPALLSEPSGHMARTNQYFGSGGNSFNVVLVSQALTRAIQAARIKGAAFQPIANP